jgi:cyclase
MIQNRVIPCLLLRNGGLVKTQKFSEPKYVGDPINAVRIFNVKEVDELLVLDIDASKKNTEPDYSLIEQFAGESFMPVCYGGGIRTLDQARRVFSCGIEKISLQSALLKDFQLVSEVAQRYGNQAVVVSVDVKKTIVGGYKLYSAASGKTLEINYLDFICKAIEAGAGEILINAVDKDGTMSGMDTVLIKHAASVCSVPLIAMGGVGSIADIREGVLAGANAISAGAFFVYHGKHRAVLITYPKYNELTKLLG